MKDERIDIGILKSFFENMNYDVEGVYYKHTFKHISTLNNIKLGKAYKVVVSDSDGFDLLFDIYLDATCFKINAIYEEGQLLLNSSSNDSKAWCEHLNNYQTANARL